MTHRDTPPIGNIELKGSSVQAMRALLRSTDLATLEAELDQKLGNGADFFSGEPLVIDCAELGADAAAPDWARLRELFSRFRLMAVAVRSNDAALAASARAAGLVVLPAEELRRGARAVEAPPAPASEVLAVEPAALEAVPTRTGLIVDKPLRSGQQVYARDGDLIMLAMVSAGAEVIADGSIHVYAPLRGRALAGASGDTRARILATCFEPELVSIGGVWRTFASGLAPEVARKPAQVRLNGEGDALQLSVAPLPII